MRGTGIRLVLVLVVLASACGAAHVEDRDLAETVAPRPAPVSPVEQPAPPREPGPAQPSRPPPEPRRFTIAASGDLLIHGGVRKQAARYGEASGQAFDFRPMFDEVRPVLEGADLAICHLEVPLSADNTGLSGYPLFSAPRELAQAIAYAGFDACSTASNHSMDRGGEGATQTLDLLDAAGVAHAGMARTEQEARAPTVFTVDGIEVAHLSYTYGLNGMPLPTGKPWMVDLIDEEQILADAQRARDVGAGFVVASMHWGAEYQREPTGEQRRLAEAMLGEGAVDLVLGHHAHVVQPIDRIGDRYVVYGLGNFLSNQSVACCPRGSQDGVITLIDVVDTEDGPIVSDVTYVPTWVDRDDFAIVDVGSALQDPDLPDGRHDTLTASWDRTVSAITSGGLDDLEPVRPGTARTLPLARREAVAR